MSKHLFLIIGAGAGVIASVVLAFKAGRRCDEILEKLDEEDAGFLKKAVAVAKEAAPAICAVAATGGALAASYTGREYEYNQAKREIRKLSDTANGFKENFNDYRNALIKKEGKEKDHEIVREITEPVLLLDGDDGEIQHYWKLDDFLKGAELRFNASTRQVLNGMGEVNRILNSNIGEYPNSGEPTVSDFLRGAEHPELCNEITDRAGWSMEIIDKHYHTSWIKSEIVRSITDSKDVTYSLDLDILPYYDVREVYDEMSAMGEL